MEPGARALLHANQPSLRLPAALPPSSRPPSSAPPPPACGAPSFPAGPPPPPPASCSLAFPRVLPAAGEWNLAITTACLAGREPQNGPLRHPLLALLSAARQCTLGSRLRQAPTPRELLGPVDRGSRPGFHALEKWPRSPRSCAYSFSAQGIERVGQ